MTDLRKAAEMALKYFEGAYGLEDREIEIKEALRQALAQPTYEFECPRCGHCCQQREWVDLTEDEYLEILNSSDGVYEYLTKLEAKLKEKNT